MTESDTFHIKDGYLFHSQHKILTGVALNSKLNDISGLLKVQTSVVEHQPQPRKFILASVLQKVMWLWHNAAHVFTLNC